MSRLGGITGRQAAEELQVYLRTMSAAQRRWAKEISAHESNVRKLMMAEDQHRDRLRRSVLRGTYESLKFLVNTDLLTTAQVATPPPAETFLAYGIPASQVTAFSVYAMARLYAEPDRVNVPPLTLVADLQGAWAILPPPKKAAYEQLAVIFREHIARHTPPEALKSTASEAKAQHSKRLRRAATKRSGGGRAARVPAATVAVASPTKAPAACVAPETPAAPPVPEWERAAFDRFAKQSRAHMRVALGGGKLSAKEWLPIAQAEWETKSARQKRSYVKEW